MFSFTAIAIFDANFLEINPSKNACYPEFLIYDIGVELKEINNEQ
jgi:hypothetical protein